MMYVKVYKIFNWSPLPCKFNGVFQSSKCRGQRTWPVHKSTNLSSAICSNSSRTKLFENSFLNWVLCIRTSDPWNQTIIPQSENQGFMSTSLFCSSFLASFWISLSRTWIIQDGRCVNSNPLVWSALWRIDKPWWIKISEATKWCSDVDLIEIHLKAYRHLSPIFMELFEQRMMLNNTLLSKNKLILVSINTF